MVQALFDQLLPRGIDGEFVILVTGFVRSYPFGPPGIAT